MPALEEFAERLSVETSIALGPDGAPALQEDEQASCSYDRVAANIADGVDLGEGRLVLTTRWGGRPLDPTAPPAPTLPRAARSAAH
jgi:hypothetical protein